MGRGRAKAKQTKVARELKYRSVETDFSSLERELRGESYHQDDDRSDSHDDEVPDAYADLAARYNVDEDDQYGGYGDMRKSG